MRLALIGNGPVAPHYATQLKQYDYSIAIDGGVRHCNQFGLTPNQIVGDGDSATITFKTNPDQTTTDLQKALAQAMVISPTAEIDLYGVVSEERLDHTFTAMLLLANYENIRHIFTDHWDIQYLTSGHSADITAPLSSIISIIPETTTAKLELTGLKWSGDVTLTTKNSGISNTVVSAPAQVTVKHGSVILMQQLWT